MKNTILGYGILILGVSLQAEIAEPLCVNPGKRVVHDKAQKSTYVNCKRNGMTYWYTDKGKIKSQVNFKEGQENGLYTSYYDNGEKKLVVNYVNGQKDGIQKIYFDNGVLGAQVNYNMGKREGVLTEWDIDGFKYSEVFYKNNYMVGLKKYYDHKGNVVRTEEYKMDRNPVMLRLLKDKEKEIFIDLAKYGLMPEDAPKEQRIR